jgi:Flp pilus assembly protein CpaB
VPAGAALQAADLQTVALRLPIELQGTAIAAAEEGQVVGRVASGPLHPGELLVRAQLGGRPAVPPGGGVIALPVGATSAAGGRIQVGDHVRIIATWNKGRDDARTRTVLPDAVVEDVTFAAPTALGGGGRADQATVSALSVVAPDPTAMEQLAAAKEDAALDVVWLAPPAPAGGVGPVHAAPTAVAAPTLAAGTTAAPRATPTVARASGG